MQPPTPATPALPLCVDAVNSVTSSTVDRTAGLPDSPGASVELRALATPDEAIETPGTGAAGGEIEVDETVKHRGFATV